MTQLDLGTSSLSQPPTSPKPRTGPSRKRRVTIALILSLIAPGLGQVYDRKPWRGLVMAIALSAVLLGAGELRLLITLGGLFGSLLLSLVWRLWVTGDAVYLAWKGSASSDSNSWVKPTFATVLILLLGVYPTPDFLLNRWTYFRAFKVPSQSMCPTICVGDRIVANMDAYKTASPQRGEVVLFDKDESNVKWIKRVVAVSGDTVAPGPHGAILVNGKTLVFQGACGNAPLVSTSEVPVSSFEPTKVPPNSVFLIGDNVDNSYDSRYFGSVPTAAVKGKPLFIYWSPDHSRISCKIH